MKYKEKKSKPAPKTTRGVATLDDAKAPKDWRASLLTLMSCPDLASKAWIWHQYDHLIMGNTAIRPQDGDAAVVRVPGGHKGLAMTSDCTPRYVFADPVAINALTTSSASAGLAR